jgi:hypothetical protein
MSFAQGAFSAAVDRFPVDVGGLYGQPVAADASTKCRDALLRSA